MLKMHSKAIILYYFLNNFIDIPIFFRTFAAEISNIVKWQDFLY